MENFHVEVSQGENKIHFAFNSFSDAKEFANTCMEVADEGARVTYYQDVKGDDKG